MTLDQGPLVVTPGGHDVSVWASTLREARHVSFDDLAAVLSPSRPSTLIVACVDHVGPRPIGIAARRIKEWHAAVSRLGFTDRHLLGLPDGRLSEHEDALADRLTTPSLAHP